MFMAPPPPPHPPAINSLGIAGFLFPQKSGGGASEPGFCLHMGDPGKLISETSFKGERHY